MNNYNDHFKKLKQNQQKAAPRPKLRIDYSSNKRQGKLSSSVGLGLVLSLALVAGGYGYLFPEDINYVLEHVDIGVISQSLAADTTPAAATPAETKDPQEEKTGASAAEPKGEKETRKPSAVKENANYIEHLIAKEDELNSREKRLQEMEEKLQKEKDELQKKIDELELARKNIASRLDKRVAEDEENVNKLVGVYANMKPQSAAMIITKLDENLAVSVLKRMKKQDAGSILNFIEPAKAKVLSEKYSGY